MSQTIDNKVVSMSFDNKDFESNVATTLSTLDKLKQKLNFSDASKGFSNITSAAKDVDLSSIDEGTRTTSKAFLALEVAAINAMSNMITKATSTGASIVKALSIDGVIDGYKEYELKLDSVQTILANTQSKGTTMDDVTNALQNLNTYADKTIYNFGQMTRNIGTFTAAGVDLETSVSSIKGIANLAAVSGSNATQASTAMYQLSQALAAGRVSLMDWNSVVNAGMGGELFQNALKRTARNLGEPVDEAIEKYGSFRDSLTQGEWLTTEVLTETLSQLAGAYSEKDLLAKGYTQSEVQDIMKLADTAVDAATKVKTLSQLIDTTKEAVGSGWAESWELIVGNFDEAKELFTGISDTINDAIAKSADYRNAVLTGWKDLGGRADLIDSLKNAFEGLMSVVTPIKEAFQDIFPPITTQNLLDFTSGLKDLTSKMKLSNDSSVKLKTTFKGLFSILDIGKQAITAVLKPLYEFVTGGTVGSIGNAILTITAGFGKFFIKLNEGIKTGKKFSAVSDLISSALDGVGSAVSFVAKIISGLKDVFSGIGDIVESGISALANGINSVLDWLREHITASDILAGLTGGAFLSLSSDISALIAPITEKLTDMFDTSIKSVKYSTKTLKSSITDLLNGLHDALTSFMQGMKVGSIVAIAAAVMVLAQAVKILADIKDPGAAVTALTGLMTIMFALNSALTAISVATRSFGSVLPILAVAAAVKVLADAVEQLSSIDVLGLVKGLVSLAVTLKLLSAAVKSISKVSGSTLETSASLVALAVAVKIMAGAIEDLSTLDAVGVIGALVAIGLVLAEMVVVTKALSKIDDGSLKNAAAVVLLAHSLNEIADAISELAGFEWGELQNAVIAIGLVLGEIVAVLAIMNTIKDLNGIKGAATILIAVHSLNEIADALVELSGLTMDEVTAALVGLGGALTEVGVVAGVLGELAGMKGLLGAATLVVAVQGLGEIADALVAIGGLTMDEVMVALVGLFEALTIVGGMSAVLGTLAPVAAIVGAGAIFIAVQGLQDLANALQKFGSMTWDEVQVGISGMILALGALAAGSFLNTLSLLGSISISVVAESLGTLAESVQKWSGVTLPENLGAQLTSLAGGLLPFTADVFAAGAISILAEPLGTLAESVQKWSGVTLPENLGTQLAGLALGITAFTLGGLGAATLVLVAAGLSLLADAIIKFQGVDLSSIAGAFSSIGDTISNLGSGVLDSFNSAFESAGQTVSNVTSSVTVDVEGMMTNFVNSIQSRVSGIISDMQSIMDGIWNSITSAAGNIVSAITQIMSDFAAAISNTYDQAVGAIQNVLSGVKGAISNASADIVGAITSVMNSFNGAISKAKSDASSAMGEVTSAIKSAADVASELYNIGVNVIQGLINGITAKASAVTSALSGVVSRAVAAVEAKLGINSPSKVMKEIGEYTVEGFVVGVEEGMPAVEESLSKIGTFVSDVRSNLNSSMKNAGTMLANALAVQNNDSFIIGDASLLVSLDSTEAEADAETTASSVATTLDTTMTSSMTDTMTDLNEVASTGMTQVSTTIQNAMDSIAKNMRKSGQQIVRGLINGIESMISAAHAEATALAQSVVDGVESTLNINSPSRVMKEIGEYTVEGFVVGVDDSLQTVNKVGEAFADTFINSVTELKDRYSLDELVTGMNGTTSRIANAISDDMNLSPTIRPVLDLSDVQNKAKTLDTMLSRRMVISANSDFAAQASSPDYGNAQNTTSGNSYQFVQNNYSPKALSRVEIYRRTKNQFATMKGLIEA